jgi:hypothetical protein
MDRFAAQLRGMLAQIEEWLAAACACDFCESRTLRGAVTTSLDEAAAPKSSALFLISRLSFSCLSVDRFLWGRRRSAAGRLNCGGWRRVVTTCSRLRRADELKLISRKKTAPDATAGDRNRRVMRGV